MACSGSPTGQGVTLDVSWARVARGSGQFLARVPGAKPPVYTEETPLKRAPAELATHSLGPHRRGASLFHCPCFIRYALRGSNSSSAPKDFLARRSAGLAEQGSEPSHAPGQALTPCPLSQKLGEGVRPGSGAGLPLSQPLGEGAGGEGRFPPGLCLLAQPAQHFCALIEMVAPDLSAGIEQEPFLASQGILARRAICFRQIAGSTGERTIGLIVSASQRGGNGMLQMKAAAADVLGRLTVLAASACGLLDPRTQRAMTHRRPRPKATRPADGAARREGGRWRELSPPPHAPAFAATGRGMRKLA